ncbi:MAG: 50S ribosomal protein L23 [Patescibacteria group bacterium]|nr:50S ribosomal protein L23 [Patescibacteria group bacterium]
MPSNKQNTTDIQLRVSEKAGDLRGLNQFVFVIKNALNKSEVKKQIEKKYKVNVIGMNIVRIAKKNLKKAIVTLKKGQIINEKI